MRSGVADHGLDALWALVVRAASFIFCLRPPCAGTHPPPERSFAPAGCSWRRGSCARQADLFTRCRRPRLTPTEMADRDSLRELRRVACRNRPRSRQRRPGDAGRAVFMTVTRLTRQLNAQSPCSARSMKSAIGSLLPPEGRSAYRCRSSRRSATAWAATQTLLLQVLPMPCVYDAREFGAARQAFSARAGASAP
jgi:hypothetical protein